MREVTKINGLSISFDKTNYYVITPEGKKLHDGFVNVDNATEFAKKIKREFTFGEVQYVYQKD